MPISNSPCLASSGSIIVQSKKGDVYSFYPDSGLVEWMVILPPNLSRQVGSPSIDNNDRIYTAISTDKITSVIYAISPEGQNLWNVSIPGYITVTISIGLDNTLYFNTKNENFYALDSTAGSIKWQYNVETPFCSSAALDRSGNIYINCNYMYS